MVNIIQDISFLIILIVCMIAKIQDIKINKNEAEKNTTIPGKLSKVLLILIFVIAFITI